MKRFNSFTFFTLIIIFVATFVSFTNAQIIDQNTCAEDDMFFADNATNCLDEDPIACGIIFEYGDERDPKCENPDLYVEALRCANTCLACCARPEFSCSNDPTSPIDCLSNAKYCKNSNWTTIMNTYCPSTCGTCLTGGNCRDRNAGCRDYTPLCNDITFRPYMLERCARTCNFCTASTATTASPSAATVCSDVAINCAINRGLCNNSIYYTIMTQKCARTCARCPTNLTSNLITNTCVDANSNCALWIRNGFCNNTFYTTAQKRSYCARSCNLC